MSGGILHLMERVGTSDNLLPVSLEIRDLRMIMAIADEGSMTRASERLNVTQSALSHQLRTVEDRLQVTLFDRVKKRLVLTDPGRRLLDRSRVILRDLVALETEIRDYADGDRGVLRLTTQCYTCYHWLPALLTKFQRRYPAVELRIVPEATSDPVSALLDGAVDLALTMSDEAAAHRNLESSRIFSDEVMLVVGPDHRLASRAVIRREDLAEETLIMHSPKDSSVFYERYFGGQQEGPAGYMVVPLSEAIRSLVHAGVGVSALARWSVEPDVRRGFLHAIPFAEPFQRDWFAVMVSRARQPQYLDAFISLIRKFAPSERIAAAPRRAAS